MMVKLVLVLCVCGLVNAVAAAFEAYDTIGGGSVVGVVGLVSIVSGVAGVAGVCIFNAGNWSGNVGAIGNFGFFASVFHLLLNSSSSLSLSLLANAANCPLLCTKVVCVCF